jgi:hypothetical protein
VTTRDKPTEREAWDAIDEASFRAEVDHIVAMTDEEVEADLVKAGFDPAKLAAPQAKEAAQKDPAQKAEDAEVAAALAAAETDAKPARVRRLPFRGRMAVWLVAAAVGGGAAATMAPGLTGHGDSRSSIERAEALRKDARAACAKAQWRTCLERLDEADRVDPGGASDANVKALREQAERGVGGTGGAH